MSIKDSGRSRSTAKKEPQPWADPGMPRMEIGMHSTRKLMGRILFPMNILKVSKRNRNSSTNAQRAETRLAGDSPGSSLLSGGHLV